MKTTYYHGSSFSLPIGTVLEAPIEKVYWSTWGNNKWNHILEKYRPANCLPRSKAVFMADNAEDVGMAGGGEDFIYEVEPIGPVEKHDVNWISTIECGISEQESEETLRQYADNYWKGIPHTDEQVWEYLVMSAKVISLFSAE